MIKMWMKHAQKLEHLLVKRGDPVKGTWAYDVKAPWDDAKGIRIENWKCRSRGWNKTEN
jgi:hypothetical protein